MKTTRKRISSADLTRVLQIVCEKSCISETATSLSFDFALATPFITEESLENHILSDQPRGKKLYPLNSERHIYGINNLIFRDLDIEMGLNLNLGRDSIVQRINSSGVNWHFEDCRFQPSSSNMASLSFGWQGFFRFYNNELDYGDSRGGRTWLFFFESGSSVLFEGNDFKSSSIQISYTVGASPHVQKLSWRGIKAYFVRDASYQKAMIRKNHGLPETVRLEMPDMILSHVGLAGISFVGNKAIDRLDLMCRANQYVFRGTNCINNLWFRESDFNLRELTSIYFGSRERIDPGFNNSLHHRALFLSMKKYGVEKEDAVLVDALNKQLDRIEYFRAKDQNRSLLRNSWLEYWQDRIRYEWRRWSCDHYRSWLRPLSFLVLGYVGLNALPGFWIEDFTVSDWIAFSLRSIDRIPFYTAGLKDLHGSAYESLSSGSMNWLRLLGLFQVIWVALWGFALSKSIRR